MKKKIWGFIFLFALTLCLALCAPSFATGGNAAAGTLHVTVYSNLPGEFYIKAVDADNMSWGFSVTVMESNGAYTGDCTFTLPPGSYRVYQGSAKNYGFYTLSTTPLQTVTITAGGEAEASIRNTYTQTNPPPEGQGVDISVTLKWEGDSLTHVQLYANNSAHGPSMPLKAENNWSYTWPNMNSGYTWTVAQETVPTGYVATVARNGLNFTITNTKTNMTVPQTGSISLLGFVLMGAGLLCFKRKNAVGWNGK